MNYELAKKLKDAGFPYIQKDVVFNRYEKVWKYIPSSIGEDPMATDPQLIPTLPELIDACGDDFSHLKKVGYHWWAVSHTATYDGVNSIEETAHTPEEAVANLWIALNTK